MNYVNFLKDGSVEVFLYQASVPQALSLFFDSCKNPTTSAFLFYSDDFDAKTYFIFDTFADADEGPFGSSASGLKIEEVFSWVEARVRNRFPKAKDAAILFSLDTFVPPSPGGSFLK